MAKLQCKINRNDGDGCQNLLILYQQKSVCSIGAYFISEIRFVFQTKILVFSAVFEYALTISLRTCFKSGTY